LFDHASANQLPLSTPSRLYSSASRECGRARPPAGLDRLGTRQAITSQPAASALAGAPNGCAAAPREPRPAAPSPCRTRTMLTYQHSLADVAVAEVRFPDGSIRTAWRTEDGLQYVEDDNGEPVCGVWYTPPDENLNPLIVGAVVTHANPTSLDGAGRRVGPDSPGRGSG
jgi:hypothetical protein